MSNYDFDQITDRRNTGSLKWDVAENELPMWVADRLVSGIYELVGETPSVFHQKRMADLLYRRGTGDLEYGPQADHTGRKRADPDTGV